MDFCLSLYGRGGVLNEEIENAFNEYLTKDEQESLDLRALKKDIAKCYCLYDADPIEYFAFGYREHKHKKRKTLLTNRFKDKVLLKKVGKADFKLVNDKIEFYERFKEFFMRDVLILNTKSEEKLIEFNDFLHKHKRVIAKPINGKSGKGIEIITSIDTEATFNRLTENGDYIIEELIIQNEWMKSFNSSSVNTIRIPSFLNKNGFFILRPFIRMGRAGSFVDNTGARGLFAVIDEKSGRIVSEAYNHVGVRTSYTNHPDSGTLVCGNQVPEWDSLLNLAEKLHRKIPNQKYIGWDFALTDNGWVPIECNWGRFISEYATREGIKSQFLKMFD